jgi:hypothetical protein
MANPGDNKSHTQPDPGAIPVTAKLTFSSSDDLLKLLAHSSLDESQLLLLLERKDLPGFILDEIGRHRDWLRNYRVKRALAFHPHVPRTLTVRLLRDLVLVDLVRISLAPVAVADLRRLAEDLIMSRLGQVSLGEKIALAKRASARVLAALVMEGIPRVFEPALRNQRLSESQVLKLLANDHLPERVVVAIGSHPRWESLHNIRLAVLRHPQMPLESAVQNLPRVTAADLKALHGVKTISAKLWRAIENELKKRKTTAQRSI